MDQLTPLAVDAYSRTMTLALDENKGIPVSSAFQSFFGRGEGRTVFSPDSSLIEIDISRGNEKTAVLIPRGTEARPLTGQLNTKTQNFTTVSRAFPLAEEEGDITADQLNRRLRGIGPYDVVAKKEKLRMLAFEHHFEQIKRLTRLNERLSAQSMLDGEMDAILDTSESALTYDFYRKSTHTVTVSPLWNGSSPTIMADIDDSCALIRKDSPGLNPDIMILGETAMSSFIADSTVQTLADNRRFELINVNSNPVPDKYKFLIDGGMQARGRLTTPNGYVLWMFTYTDVYTNSSGTAVNYMPLLKVMITSSSIRCDRYFGPSELLPITAQRNQWMQEMFGFSPNALVASPVIKNASAVINPAMFYFDAYPSGDYKHLTLRTQMAPIFAPINTDAVVTLTVAS